MLSLLVMLACNSRPQSGPYATTPNDDVVTDCPSDQPLVTSTATTLSVLVSGAYNAFTMQDAGVDTPYVFTCTLDGMDFRCPVTETATLGTATVTVEADVTGTWSSPDAFAYTVDAASSCAGDDCPLFEQQGFVACGVTFTAEAVRID